MATKRGSGTPLKNSSGQGVRKNAGRGGHKPLKTGKGKK